MLLSEAALSVSGILHGKDVRFSGVNTDTRNIKSGELFFALSGDNFNGHDFLYAAQKGGAVAAVVECHSDQITIPQIVVADACRAMGALACAWRKKFKGKVVAITGSSGKTTVKGLLRSVLAEGNSVHATPGNWNNHIGVPLTLFGLKDQKFAVIELGTSHPGEISYLTELVLPDVALVNNVMTAHIEGFGSQDAIAQEKSAIYSHLSESQVAVINLDDAYASTMAHQTGFCRQVGFGVSPKTAVPESISANNIQLNVLGNAEFNLIINERCVPIELSIPGLHNVNNALAAAACAVAVGEGIDQIALGLKKYHGDGGRMQIRKGLNDVVVIDDTYNAHPGSMRAAIDFLSARSGKRIFVMGDMGELGDIADSAHAQVGEYALNKQVDTLCAVGIKSALAAKAFGRNAYFFDSQAELSVYLESIVDAQCTVLIKGSRSSHMENIVNTLCSKEQVPC